jgi:hypothetical protein
MTYTKRFGKHDQLNGKPGKKNIKSQKNLFPSDKSERDVTITQLRIQLLHDQHIWLLQSV